MFLISYKVAVISVIIWLYVSTHLLSVYRSMLRRARYFHGKSSVCGIEVLWSHRLEYFENNFMDLLQMEPPEF